MIVVELALSPSFLDMHLRTHQSSAADLHSQRMSRKRYHISINKDIILGFPSQLVLSIVRHVPLERVNFGFPPFRSLTLRNPNN